MKKPDPRDFSNMTAPAYSGSETPEGFIWMTPPRDIEHPQLVPESEQVTRQCTGWLHASPPPSPQPQAFTYEEKQYACGCSARGGPGPLPDYCPDHKPAEPETEVQPGRSTKRKK